MLCPEALSVQVTRDRLLRDAVAEEQGIAFGNAFGSGYPGGKPLACLCRSLAHAREPRRHSMHATRAEPR